MIEQLEDKSILAPIAMLNHDFTVEEWAERLNVSIEQVLIAYDVLKIPSRNQSDRPPTKVAKRRVDQYEDILKALRSGRHRTEDIASFVGLHPQTILTKLNMLAKHGLVAKTGNRGRQTRWLVTA